MASSPCLPRASCWLSLPLYAARPPVLPLLELCENAAPYGLLPLVFSRELSGSGRRDVLWRLTVLRDTLPCTGCLARVLHKAPASLHSVAVKLGAADARAAPRGCRETRFAGDSTCRTTCSRTGDCFFSRNKETAILRKNASPRLPPAGRPLTIRSRAALRVRVERGNDTLPAALSRALSTRASMCYVGGWEGKKETKS